jgi:hypothetical protein
MVASLVAYLAHVYLNRGDALSTQHGQPRRPQCVRETGFGSGGHQPSYMRNSPPAAIAALRPGETSCRAIYVIPYAVFAAARLWNEMGDVVARQSRSVNHRIFTLAAGRNLVG